MSKVENEKSDEWICNNCQSNHNITCGPWSDDSDDFKRIRDFHRDHPGWKKFETQDTDVIGDSLADTQVAEFLIRGIKQNRFRELKKDLTYTIKEKDRIIEFELLEDEIKKLRPLSVLDGVAYALIYLPVRGKTIKEGKKDEPPHIEYFQNNIPYYINSKKELLLSKDELLNQEFQLPDLGVGESVRWETMDVVDYIDINEKVDLKNVYQELHDQVKSVIELKTPDYLNVFVLWTIGTYFYRLFEYFPYLDFSGSKGSGKTKAQVILLCLCYNARMSSKITGANWARNTDALNCTILIDEQEDLLEPRTEHALNLVNLLNSAFRTDAYQPILIPNREIGWGSKTFDVGVPVALAHITPLNDITEDRAIPMKMIISKEKKVLDAEVEPSNQVWMHLRDLLYRTFLDHFKEAEKIRSEQLELESITSRERNQIWKPIITLARLFERHGVSGIEASVRRVIAETHEIRTVNNQTSNKDIQILESICDLFAEKKIFPITEKEEHKTWYQQQALHDKITESQDLKHISSKELGACLERLQLQRRKKNPHNTCVFIDRQILINLCQRYHLDYNSLLSQTSLSSEKDAEQNAADATSAQNPKIDEQQFSEQCAQSDNVSITAHGAHSAQENQTMTGPDTV